jgi:hypothetical protein
MGFFSNLPLEVGELIFNAVVWDGFSPESVDTLNSASECIDRVHERNRQLRALRPTAKFVDSIVNRLAYKYVHITSRERAEALVKGSSDMRVPGSVVRHLFLGDKTGRYNSVHADNYTWVTTESGREWIESGTFNKLLTLMPNLQSLHIHLPAIHSELFSSKTSQGSVAPVKSLEKIQCLSLYDDINNSHCYKTVEKAAGVRDSLSVFPSLRYLIISESEGYRLLDRFIGAVSSDTPIEYAPSLQRLSLEKWCPMGQDLILYNIAMEIPLTELNMLRRVPRRMSLDGSLAHFAEADHRCCFHHWEDRADVDLSPSRLFLSFCGRSRFNKRPFMRHHPR